MKFTKILTGAFLLASATWLTAPAEAQKLVLIGTNDTHSQIDPDDQDGKGGVLRRKALIDSIRGANDNVLLVDLGDAVQGTMYFNLFGGEVENMVMNEMDYDIRILGNHDFDNGVDELVKNLEKVDSRLLSTNYAFTDPRLNDIFDHYLIAEVEGKKVGFIGINLQPKGMIAEGNYDGVEYLDALEAANSTAWHLKHNEGVDKVVALTHIGYYSSGNETSDTKLAAASSEIDLIMGGHSHTVINPADTAGVSYLLPAKTEDGTVMVTQAGKSGKYVAVVEMDLESGNMEYKLLPVDARYDDRLDSHLDSLIMPYRKGVEAVMNKPVGRTARAFDKDSDELLNLVSDFIRDRGKDLYGDIDFAIVNKGGIRRGLPKGTITQGQIQSMLPFNNKVVVLEISGQDILDNFGIMARTQGNGISEEAAVVYDPETRKIVEATVKGQPIDPNRTYRIATIDYLANGGDYMTPLTHGKVVAASKDKVYDDFLAMLTTGRYKGKKLNAKTTKRFRPKI